MVRSSRFPLLNQFRFIPANDGLALGVANFPPDRGFFHQQIRSWQAKNYYRQLSDYRDQFGIYIDSLAPEVDLWLLNDKGEVVAGPFPSFPMATLPGNTVDIGGSAYGYNSFYMTYRLSDLFTMTEVQNTYYLVLEEVYNVPGDSDSVYQVSEPVHVSKDGWPNTRFIEATHPVNAFDVYLFETTGVKFCKRILAELSDELAPASEDVAFEDQLHQIRTLDSTPLRIFQLIIKNAPAYEIDKVNRFLSCKSFQIDGIRYSKDSGAKMSVTGEIEDPLRSAKIPLREYSLKDQGRFDAPEFVPIVKLVGTANPTLTYPLAINKLRLHAFTTLEYPHSVVLEDASSTTNFLLFLNNVLMPSQGLAGEYLVQGDFLGYMPVSGEAVTPPATGVCFSFAYFLELEVKKNGVPGAFPMNFSAGPGGGLGHAIIDFGDTTVTTYAFGSAYSTVPHVWPGATGTVYNLRIFHAGADGTLLTGIDRISITVANNVKVTDIIGGDAPKTLSVWNLNNQDMQGHAIDCTFLEVARANLTYVSMQNNAIGVGVVSPGVLNIFQTPNGWPKLKTLLLNLNYIISGDLHVVLNDMQTCCNPINTGGTLMIKQTVAAPISGGPLIYVGILNTVYAWTVSHD